MIGPAHLAPRLPRRAPGRAPDDGPRLEGEYRPDGPLDLFATVAVHQRGPGDPTQTIDRAGRVIWRASRTPEGVATLALRQRLDGSVMLAAWGPGREWAIAQAPALCGARDDPSGFAPRHPVVAEAHRRNPGMRIGRTDLVFDALAQVITEQKVTLRQAFGAWRHVVAAHGERAPGPTPVPLHAPPTPEGWRRVPSWSWHRAGLEPPQARTIVEAASRAGALERLTPNAEAPAAGGRGTGAAAPRTGRARPAEDPAAPSGADPARPAEGPASAPRAGLDTALSSLRGIGAWTIAETRIRALGDADAVSVGDYHLSHQVGYALTGSRVDDAGMLELLEPWAGHRYRVIRLIRASGVAEPRRGARVHMQDHRAH